MRELYFSVVVPLFNSLSDIPKLIATLNSQTHSNFEVIFVDDCSDDYEAVEKLISSNLKVKNSILRNFANKGGGYSRNKGLKEARGKFVAFLDSDDTWHPEKLQIIENYLNKNYGVEFLYHQLRCRKPDGREFLYPSAGIKIEENLLEYLFCNNGLIQTSSIVCASELAKRHPFDDSLIRHQDWDFVTEIWINKIQLRYIPAPLGVWNVRPSTGANKRDLSSLSIRWYSLRSKIFTQKARAGFFVNVLALRLLQEGKYLTLVKMGLSSIIQSPLGFLSAITKLYLRIRIKRSSNVNSK